jgi:hypothetical protein
MGSLFPVLMEHFFKLMPDIVAVGKAGGSAYITGNQKLFVSGNYTARSSAFTGCPF